MTATKMTREQRKSAKVAKGFQLQWIKDRDQVIKQIIEICPQFCVAKLETFAATEGLVKMWDLRDTMRKATQYTEQFTV